MSQLKSTKIRLNKHTFKLALSSVFLLAIAVCSLVKSASIPQESGAINSAQSNEQIAPKRQYFIAPRVSRSQGQATGQTRSIWTPLDDGVKLIAPDQVQPIRGYLGPLSLPLMYLIGNWPLNELRAPASLLSHTRIGRRASPGGLLPQPRVGRRLFNSERSSVDTINDLVPLDDGQQEASIGATSDIAARNDAVELFLNADERLQC